MTEAEAIESIRKWAVVCRVGDPSEADYGTGEPREYGLSSAERVYVSDGRDHWLTTDELIAERTSKPTRADYDLIEPVYQGLPVADRYAVTGYYFGQRGGHTQKEAQQRFLHRVMAL